MFHPVGSQPPNVYWRRRLLVLGSTVIVLVLMAVTVSALMSGTSGTQAGAGGPSTTPVADRSSTPPSGHGSSTHRSSGHPPTPSSSHHSGHRRTKSGPPKSTPSSSVTAACRTSNLTVAAVAGRSSYHVGAQPKVELQVTNVGPAPCVQDLADKQILLKVYNGVSRVWGSHDCEIQPGVDKHILAVGAPVRVSITWSGETSQPGCKGTRQQVGAGTYTLYATLSGKTGKAAQFTIS